MDTPVDTMYELLSRVAGWDSAWDWLGIDVDGLPDFVWFVEADGRVSSRGLRVSGMELFSRSSDTSKEIVGLLSEPLKMRSDGK